MFLLHEYDIFWAISDNIKPCSDFSILDFRSFSPVFLYPWAMSFDVLGVSVFIEAFIFVLILIGGSVYAWRKGALEWS
ncbi:hypothetical protein LUZ62_003387 [Rhynchospora pubera]|uniref:NADH-ubiquinone oxidoreductase chain 3 n=1 Tax=Rhynchospora pubera TaxID=906938 RepID=A0AAV8BD31_9POAL|nr:hypothetical protein LUZ62_003387 [Rhynchospora pubera]